MRGVAHSPEAENRDTFVYESERCFDGPRVALMVAPKDTATQMSSTITPTSRSDDSAAKDSSPVFDPNDLQVSRIRALRGPNYWRLAPVIACDVRLGSL